jgi:hypothetical protein
MRLTNETRIKASGNLIQAAIQAGVRRYVAESFFLVYGVVLSVTSGSRKTGVSRSAWHILS